MFAALMVICWSAGPSFEHVVTDAGGGGYEAFPDVCRLTDGRLMCVFYDSIAHVGLPSATHPKGGRVSYVTFNDEGKTWSEPRVLVDTPDDDRDPSIVQLADGRILCNFFVITTGTQGSAFDGRGTWICESTDGGTTWSDPRQIAESAYCSSPIRVLTGGRLILGLYREGSSGATGAVTFSDDHGKTWSDVVEIPNGGRRLDAETDIFERVDGSLYAIQRAEKGDMGWSESTDQGRTWSVSQPVGFPGHCPYLHRAPDGKVLLATRLPQTTLRWSSDDGKTWSEPIMIDDVIGAYPSMVTRKDGTILVVYYEEGDGSSLRARRFRVSASGVEWLPIE
jgi:hypothetical protein